MAFSLGFICEAPIAYLQDCDGDPANGNGDSIFATSLDIYILEK
jgi:hypothetical protein